MKILICDNDGRIHEIIKNNISKCSCGSLNENNTEIISLKNGKELIDYYHFDNNADILFLDMEMDCIDGVTAGKIVRAMDKDAIIIFISDNDKKVIESLDCIVFNFIQKPFEYERFADVFTGAWNLYNSNHRYYIISNNKNITGIEVNIIKYIECYNRHTVFHTLNGDYESTTPLKAIINDLASYGFIQTHQGYLVNMKYMIGVEKNDVVLDDGTRIMLSNRRRSEIIEAYRNYVARISANYIFNW